MTHIGKLMSSASLALIVTTSTVFAEGKIAYFAASSQNGFNQATYEGVQEMAAKLGYETEVFDLECGVCGNVSEYRPNLYPTKRKGKHYFYKLRKQANKGEGV